jgi:hypothetical protein
VPAKLSRAVSTPLTQHPRNQYTLICCFLLGSGLAPVTPTNLRETCRRGLVSLPPRGCWFFNPFSRSIARPLLQAFSLPLPYALVAFHSSYHSLISRPGVRSLRHSWSLHSLTDYPSSYPRFILHFITTRPRANIKKTQKTIKGTQGLDRNLGINCAGPQANILASSVQQIQLPSPVHCYTDKVTRLEYTTESTA